MIRSVLVTGACMLALLVVSACVVADYGPAYQAEPYPDYDVYYWWGWPYWDHDHHPHRHDRGWHHDGGRHRFHH